jgi:hypothetical protein
MIIGEEQHPYKITNVHKNRKNETWLYWSDFTKNKLTGAKIDALFSPYSPLLLCVTLTFILTSHDSHE